MIVHKLLAKSPGDRFASATEVAQLLEGCLAHVQQPGTVPPSKECPVVPRRLSSLRRWSLVVGMCVFAGVVGLSLFSKKPALIEPPSSGEPTVISTEPSASWDAGEESVAPLRSDFNKWQKDAETLWDDAPP